MREDWIEVELGDILKLKNGFAFKASNYRKDGVSVLRIGDINDWVVSSKNAVKIEEKEAYNDFIVENGDILIAMSGATTGKFGIYTSTEKAYQNQRVGNLRLYSENSLNKKFIFYLLYSLKRDIEREAYGGAQPNISGEKIEVLKIKFPPLPIQRAIVSKIEALFSDLDNGIVNFKKAQEQLKIYRQAVLKKAFEGGFSITNEELRITNEGNLDSDSLPKGWKWVKLGEVVEKIQIGPFGSQLHKEDYIESGIPLINPMHIKDGKIIPDYAYSITAQKQKSLPNYVLQTGDIVMGRRGEMGRCGLVTQKESGWFCGTGSLYIRPKSKQVNSVFLHLVLSGAEIKKYLQENAAGTTMANLNSKIVNGVLFRLPPFPEQTQIVQEIERRLSVCDKMEQSIKESLAKAEALRQSILKKAFEGKLLTEAEIQQCKQEADYEPASELLKKITNEKLRMTNEKKVKKVKIRNS